MRAISLLLAVAGAAHAYRGSILFDTFMSDDPVSDPCYDDKLKKSIACIPDFVNAAFGIPVEASSTCGETPREFCTAPGAKKEPKRKRNIGDFGSFNMLPMQDSTAPATPSECQLCDRTQRDFQHPAEFLTDLHNPNNVTCWQSDLMTQERSGNVSLTISLKKKYELTYISLHFCHAKPHSMALYKSMDHGKTWQPFQYYSKDCKAVFNLDRNVKITRANEQEALCVDDHARDESSLRIAFSTLANRPSSEDFENSPVLQDWVTATDIRVVFPPANEIGSNSQKPIKKSPPKTSSKKKKLDFAPKIDLIRTKKSLNSSDLDYLVKDMIRDEEEYVDDLANDDYDDMFDEDNREEDEGAEKAQPHQWVGVSDLAIGGRCKCNGHASDCSLDRSSGEMRCNCKHNTAGQECEKCKPFHFDRPWGRATSGDANECVACNCNNHARRCRFNMELYQLSGGVSGGVCLKCRHNTAGRHCHYCKEGYFRNSKRDITHRKACEACNCHPVGALGKICSQTNGQCPCKDGVTGRECNRCAKGYQQSGSPIAPCIKVRIF